MSSDYPIYSPRTLWSEQDPLDWWSLIGGGIAVTLAVVRLAVSFPYYAGLVGLVVGYIAFRSWVQTRRGK